MCGGGGSAHDQEGKGCASLHEASSLTPHPLHAQHVRFGSAPTLDALAPNTADDAEWLVRAADRPSACLLACVRA